MLVVHDFVVLRHHLQDAPGGAGALQVVEEDVRVLEVLGGELVRASRVGAEEARASLVQPPDLRGDRPLDRVCHCPAVKIDGCWQWLVNHRRFEFGGLAPFGSIGWHEMAVCKKRGDWLKKCHFV